MLDFILNRAVPDHFSLKDFSAQKYFVKQNQILITFGFYIQMMKTRLLRLSVLMLAFTLTSCDQILDNYWERKAQEQYVSP